MNGFRFRSVVSALLLGVVPQVAAGQGGGADLSLDSLLNTRISAASKYEQTTTEAPASVTILTSDHLERLGYSRLGQVLEGVRGFYLSDDRNYSYLGTRGFSRPTDYNNRILLLIDGHTLNEQTWGGAPIGDDLPLNISAIERIEIIRGPGSTLYGTSAMFAVINVVMRTSAALDGAIVGARVGGAGRRQVTLAAGHALGRGFDFTGSALVSQSDGDALYYAEYDDPETNNGRTFGTDWDRTASALATLKWKDAALRTGIISRSKGVPTGAFESTFDDPRNWRTDKSYWAELALARQYGGQFRASGRVYYDWYDYVGSFAGPEDPPYVDEGGSSSLGAELLGVWDLSSSLRLTMGGEYRDIDRAHYVERFSDGSITQDDAPFRVVSVFGQAEYQVSSRLTATAGLRTEDHSLSGSATAPRGALILAPTPATTLKLLYGQAYRAPSVAEAHLETSFYERNPALRQERIQTLELALSHRFTSQVLAAMSVYEYRIRDLIDQVEVTSEGSLRFENSSNSRGAGIEFEVDARATKQLQLRGSYAYQRATLDPDAMRLTNAPEHIGLFEATMTDVVGVRPTVSLRYETGRITVGGATTEAFLRTDLHVGLARRWGFDAGLQVSNLFDVAYAVPVGIEHRQDSIRQRGRRYGLYGSWRF